MARAVEDRSRGELIGSQKFNVRMLEKLDFDILPGFKRPEK